jgi:hypothetical protein
MAVALAVAVAIPVRRLERSGNRRLAGVGEEAGFLQQLRGDAGAITPTIAVGSRA